MHNVENPVTFDEAKKQLGCSDYKLTALKKQLGIKGRLIMLSTVRDFLTKNPGWTTTAVYPNHKKQNRGYSLRIMQEGKRWVVSMTSVPSVMAEDSNLFKALEIAAKQVEGLHKAA